MLPPTTAESADSRLLIASFTNLSPSVPEPLAIVAWLTEPARLSAWGSLSRSFAWDGDHGARFVVLPAGSEWYSAEQAADSEPISATVVVSDVTPGTYGHPELPYEITVAEV